MVTLKAKVIKSVNGFLTVKVMDQFLKTRCAKSFKFGDIVLIDLDVDTNNFTVIN